MKEKSKLLFLADHEIVELRRQLKEAQDTLEAIRGGAIDALVVAGQTGFQALSVVPAGIQFLSLGARGWQLLGGSKMPFPPKKDEGGKGGAGDKPDDDLSEYQHKETAWRYDSKCTRLRERIAHIEYSLAEYKAELSRLEANPPLYALMNWSA
jgi:predicted RNase H-like nuclease (RuvC/YqgF family)